MNMKSKEKIRNKIRSESGASLAAALLFFIVCAVVGSIIIAAAMSSAGRMSGITSADNQRYALESARSLIENAMLSDPENETTWYVNENDILSSTGTDVYQKGFTPKKGGDGKSNLEDFQEVKLSMAEELYQKYWKLGEIQSSWPEKDDQVAAQSAFTGTDNSISQNDRTDTKTTSSWVPSRSEAGIPESNYPKRKATLTVENTFGQQIEKCPSVTAEFTMRPDFSILVKLSENVSLQTGKAGWQSVYTATDSFVLYPSISMNYESVKPETGSDGSSTANNKRMIRCEIQWLDEGEEQELFE